MFITAVVKNTNTNNKKILEIKLSDLLSKKSQGAPKDMGQECFPSQVPYIALYCVPFLVFHVLCCLMSYV